MTILTKLKKRLSSSNTGFALIEAAIAIVIFGIIICSASHLFISIKQYSLIKNEKHNMHQIVYSIAEYLYQKKCLPYPKDYKEHNGLLIGTVNYEDIGIGKFYIYDRFNKPMIYIVDKNFTIPKDQLITENNTNILMESGSKTVFADDISTQNMHIFDDKGNDMPKGKVIFVLLRSDGDTDNLKDEDCIFWTTIYGFMLKYLRIYPTENIKSVL